MKAQKVTDTLISKKTVEKWKRLREKNKMKTENPKYDCMALSLKLHTNVINLDAFLRNNERHRALLKNVQPFTNNKESERTKNYRKLRKRMRSERLKEQEYHMQELSSTLRKPKAMMTNKDDNKKSKNNNSSNKIGGRFSTTAPERRKPGSSRGRSTPRHSLQWPQTTDGSDFPLSDTLKMKRPGSTASCSRGGGTPMAEGGRKMKARWVSGSGWREKEKKHEEIWNSSPNVEEHSDDEEEGNDAKNTMHHIQHIVTSESNLTKITFLEDSEFLNKSYKKYVGLNTQEMKEAIYDKVMAEIPPLVTKEDIYEEQRREWDPDVRPYDREEEEEKNLMNLQHLERMLNKFKNAGVDLDSLKQRRYTHTQSTHKHTETTKKQGGGDQDFGGLIDLDCIRMDSLRLRKLRPQLSEGGQFYSESMMFGSVQEDDPQGGDGEWETGDGGGFQEVVPEAGEAFEGAEPDDRPMEQEEEGHMEEDWGGEGEGKAWLENENEDEDEDEEGEDGGNGTTYFFHEDGFVAETIYVENSEEEEESNAKEQLNENEENTNENEDNANEIEEIGKKDEEEQENVAQKIVKDSLEAKHVEKKKEEVAEIEKTTPLEKKDEGVEIEKMTPPATLPVTSTASALEKKEEVAEIEKVTPPASLPGITTTSALFQSAQFKDVIPKTKKAPPKPAENLLPQGILDTTADGGIDIFGGSDMFGTVK